MNNKANLQIYRRSREKKETNGQQKREGRREGKRQERRQEIGEKARERKDRNGESMRMNEIGKN